MGWSIGYDEKWARDIGYGVPAVCDHPDCDARIDRGLSYVCCNQEPRGGEGCGLYFCEKHKGYLKYDEVPAGLGHSFEELIPGQKRKGKRG